MTRKIRMHLRTGGLGGLLCSIMEGVTNSAVVLKVNQKHCKHPLWLRVPSAAQDYVTSRVLPILPYASQLGVQNGRIMIAGTTRARV